MSNNKNGKYNWADPEDTEVKSCSICNEEIYGMGNNPQPVILNDTNKSTKHK